MAKINRIKLMAYLQKNTAPSKSILVILTAYSINENLLLKKWMSNAIILEIRLTNCQLIKFQFPKLNLNQEFIQLFHRIDLFPMKEIVHPQSHKVIDIRVLKSCWIIKILKQINRNYQKYLAWRSKHLKINKMINSIVDW